MLHCFLLLFVLHLQSDIDSLNLYLQDNPADINAINTLAEAFTETDNRQADSLALIALELAKAAQNIPEQARAAATISNIAFNTLNYRRVVEYAEHACALFEKLDDLVQAAYYANDAALAAYEIDLYEPASRNYRKTIRLLIESGSTEFLPAVLINLAQVYMRTGENDSALYYNRQAIALAEQPGMEAELSAAYGNMGFIYKSIGSFSEALENYKTALALSESINDLSSKATDLNNIAGIYSHWENFEMAMEYYQQALDIYKSIGRLDQAEVTMNNIAYILQKQGDTDAAMALYREALAIAQDLGRTGSVAVKLGNIGGLHYELGSYDSAIYYQQESLRLSREIGRRHSECAALQGIAAAYLAGGNLAMASKHIDEAIACALGIQAKSILEKLYQDKSDLYERLGEPAKALESYRMHMAYKDSVFTLKSKEKLDELEAIYKNEKKKHEIEILLKDKELSELRIQRIRTAHIWMASGIVVMLVASLIIFWLLIQKSKANKMLVEKNLELMKNEECNQTQSIVKQTTNVSDEEKRRLITELDRLIRQEKIFKHKQLTLIELAEILNTNTTYLSSIINHDFGRSFNDFLNQLRVREAQKIFTRGGHKTKTIEGIAEACGFHSRSAFNLNFKKITGVTPSIFISNLEKLPLKV